MKLSKYTIFVDDFPEPGQHLAYNTRTQGLVAVGSELRQLLSGLPTALESFPKEIRTILGQLETLGITLGREVDEGRLMQKWFDEIRRQGKCLEVYILTTYDCNFACPYCYEGGAKPKIYLNAEKAQEVLRWLKTKAEKLQPEKLHIDFFGGEPLMNIPVLEFIAKELHTWCETRPWDFEFTIITNGSLVTGKLIERLNPLGLQSIRVTIDGDREFHDRYRPFTGGRGSFDLLMKNIKAVAGKTKIAVTGNFNAASYRSLYRLLDYLEAEGLKERIAMIDFKPITETREQGLSHHVTAPSYTTDTGHTQKMLDIKKEIIRRGFKTSRTLDSSGLCYFKAADHQMVVDPEGILYKCPAMVGCPEKTCGTVMDMESSPRLREFFQAPLGDLTGRCRDCPYLPFCAGGCNYHAELQTGSYRDLFCQKDTYDQSVRELIKIKYGQLMKARKKQEVSNR